ncbi:MAG TPA: efflux RND transporter periplasmic adaptor subunit [Polyangia bacterium]|nr:efflux RND transporter periplasmic adaptor subunit [Polyangia bacterium]
MAVRRSKSFRWVLIVAVVGIGGGVFAWRQSHSEAPVAFRTVRIDRGPVEETVTATGALSAVTTVQVGSQVSGIIAKLGADFNSKVKEGQIIAQIDPTRFRANVAQAEASLQSAEADLVKARVAVKQAKVELDRAQELQARQVVGMAELDAARAKYDQAQADLSAYAAKVAKGRADLGIARVDLERTTIRAPISGTVLQRAVDVGQTVAASLQAPVLFTIAEDLSRMEVRAAIDEADVGKLKEGQDATFTVDAYPGNTFKGRIFQLRSQPTVVQNVVTYDAILRVDNTDGKLRPGMTASVRAVCQRRENALRVPNAALRFKPAPELVEGGGDRGGAGAGGGASGGGGTARAAERGGSPAAGQASSRSGARVYRPSGGKVAAMRFKPGIADDEYTEVASGPLKEGDEIVTDLAGGAARPPSSGGGSTRGRGPRFF